MKAALRLLVFVWANRQALGDWHATHGPAVVAAIKAAIPLIEKFQQDVAPDSPVVEQAKQAARQAIRDPASPMPGEPYSPTNPDPNGLGGG